MACLYLKTRGLRKNFKRAVSAIKGFRLSCRQAIEYNVTMKTAHIRCPSERCSQVIEILPEWLGRNMYCPYCGARMTAKPLEVEQRLLERQESAGKGTGAAVERLPLVALVDNVRSLWNVGSIFRSADACGVRELVLTGISGCPPRPEITKTALGAEEAVAWRYRADPSDALARLLEEGYEPVALETSRRAVPLERVRWPERICLVVGNEVAGVSQPVLEACERHVHIPMCGVKNSLNVAVAFGIAAFAASAALRPSPAGGD
jgi:tRNA G18 (ribose-2'-O)-methylase SpoU